jgi:hypothetical protein
MTTLIVAVVAIGVLSLLDALCFAVWFEHAPQKWWRVPGSGFWALGTFLALTTEAAMTDKRPLMCRVWGHTEDLEAARHGYNVCATCREWIVDDTGLRDWVRRWWWAHTYRIRDRWFRFRLWLRCDECGCWCGRHDDKFDHIPF